MSSRKPLRYPQLAKKPLITNRERGNPENRIVAKLIDFCLVEAVILLVSFFWLTAAWILPFVLWPMIDGLGKGQSPGKWLLGLHTIEIQKGMRTNYYNGLVRNFPFVLASLGVGPISWTWVVFLVPALLLILLESYFIFSVRSGIRVGDILGNTRVADFRDEHTQFIEQFLKEDEIY